MKFALTILPLSAATILSLGLTAPAYATGKIKCEAGPQSGWESRAALEEKLIKQGWKIKKSKIDGGCYEMYGTTPQGDRVEAYFHPVTLEKMLVSRRGKILFRKK